MCGGVGGAGGAGGAGNAGGAGKTGNAEKINTPKAAQAQDRTQGSDILAEFMQFLKEKGVTTQ